MKKHIITTLALILSCTFIFAQNLEFRDKKVYGADLSDVWGYTNGDREYAIVGLRNGISFVDVTNPDDIEEVHFIYGNPCTWRDIKTFGNFAYVTQDCFSSNPGLTIFDLTNIQDTIIRTPWRNDGTGSTPNLTSAHNIFIDEFGFAYVVGHNFGSGGIMILDLNNNPTNPTVVAQYTDTYVHDLYVRNNIAYSAEFNAGRFSIIDVSDKSNLQVLARQSTPVQRSHNIWLSDDGQTVFTTDETTATNTSIASYDISDLNDIQILDEYNSDPSATPHNVHVLNDFVVASHYSYGVVVLDGSVPDKMVEVAHYDTEPLAEGDSYDGCWGVYPYLPSGNILASDQRTGLFVLTPNYVRAIHIRGTVTNAFTNLELFNAAITIKRNTSETLITNSDLSGKFKEGFTESGTYTVTVELNGYIPYSINLDLENGDIIDLNVKLVPQFETSDTIFSDVSINQVVTICDKNTNNITIDTALSCDNIMSSAFGSWTFDNSGCVEYTANDQSGDFVDTLCMLVGSEDGIETNATVVILSIIDNTTTIGSENILENGSFQLMQNPVKNTLYLRNNLHKNSEIILNIYDVNGSKVFEQEDGGFNDIISLPVNHLSQSMYILTIQTSEKNIGFTKFIKE